VNNAMPNPNAIVSSIMRIEGDAIELGNERRVRLDPTRPEARRLLPVLEGLRALRRPVYLEIDPATSDVTRVRIPHVARVVRLAEGARGLEIALDTSHALHILRRDASDFAQAESMLRESLRSGRTLVVTEDDAPTVIDVRWFTPGPDGDLPPLPPFPEPGLPKRPWPFSWLRRLWWWRWWPWHWIMFGCVSPARAQQIFDDMAARTCDPLTIPPPCIPFLYPDDGCFARAHEMCRLMIDMGLRPRKVWINAVNGWLQANTRNHPNCHVVWGWHVTPTICVRRWFWWFLWPQRMVIDPSLFTNPVTPETWKSVQGNPPATLTHTSWTYFWQNGTSDPTFATTNHYLALYRLYLQQRSLSSVGPPPYAHCP
jgi:hypothetical protein